MDSFGLRQEQSELSKIVNELKHKLEIGEKRVKELYDEEMRYLNEIPEYKKQAEESRGIYKELSNKVDIINKQLISSKNELINSNKLKDESMRDLEDLKITHSKIIEETKQMNEKITIRHEELKKRESLVQDREDSCVIREIFNKNIEDALNQRDSEIKEKESNINKRNESLEDKLETHRNNVELHNKNVKGLIEEKEIHSNNEILLSDKIGKSNRLIGDNVRLKHDLLLQTEKLAEEIKITQARQVSLDKALEDLKNQENVLKIKDLRIQKMAHDAGLQKELKSLEETYK